MGKIKIKVDAQTGKTYIPKSMRNDGFTGVVDGLGTPFSVLLFRPGARLSAIEQGLRTILADIELRCQDEQRKMRDGTQGSPARPLVRPGKDGSGGGHPLFYKYTRAWLSEVTGYSKGYLSRVATGKITLSRSFVERVCFKLGRLEEALFLPDTVADSDQEKNIA